MWQQGLEGAEGERMASSAQLTSMYSVQDHNPCNSVTMGKARLHTSVNLISTSISGALRGTLDPSMLASNVNCHRYLVSFRISHCISTFEPWYRVLGSLWQFVGSLWVFSTFLWFSHYSWCSLPLQSLWFMLVAAKTENMAEAR